MNELGRQAPVKRIGIFTKMDMAGGSEFRAVELANTIAVQRGYESVLLVEKAMPDKLRAKLNPRVVLKTHAFARPEVEHFYTLDHLLVINSDSRVFTTEEYWLGKSIAHRFPVDLTRIKAISFLFNFIVSPSCQLPTLARSIEDIRIITTNRKFFDEISQQARYEAVRHYPRLRLESPININVHQPKSEATRLRFGMHSLPSRSKWNAQWPALVHRVNEKYRDRIAWDFMGMPQSLRNEIKADNVTFRQEFLIPVEDFLRGIDVFVFFLEWKREEAWARSAGEALMSGCPVITTARGGNCDQVVHGNTGFLCESLEHFMESSSRLIESPLLLRALQRNAHNAAISFSSENVVRRLTAFLE